VHADHAGMAKPALYEEWIASVTRLKQAQRAAGIVEPLADLSGRNACAYSKSTNRFAADYRKAVFAIPDETMRRHVIREDRENYRIYKTYLESELGSMRERAGTGGLVRRKPLWGAVAFGARLARLAQHAAPEQEAPHEQLNVDDGTFSEAEEKTGRPDSPVRRSMAAPEPLRP
jgi:hypothetical protein